MFPSKDPSVNKGDTAELELAVLPVKSNVVATPKDGQMQHFENKVRWDIPNRNLCQND